MDVMKIILFISIYKLPHFEMCVYVCRMINHVYGHTISYEVIYMLDPFKSTDYSSMDCVG